MWKTLHQLAIPPRLYQICGWFIPWLAIASVVVLTVGWIWGFGFAPADYQQGNSYRIIYLHVPAAIWSIFGFLLLSATLTLMRMRNLILLMEKRRPWVSELILKRGRK
ncbi:cytochrome c biogenesis protein CcsA [Escherichia coli]